MKKLIDYSDNPEQALITLEEMAEGSPRVQRIWRDNLARLRRKHSTIEEARA